MLLAAGIVIVIVGVFGVNLAVRLGHQLDHTGVTLSSDPFTLTFQVLMGKVPWPPSGTWIIAVVAAIVLALAVLIIVAIARYRKARTRVDRSAAYMGRGRDVADLSRKSALEKAQRLGVADAPGVPIGRTVASGQPLYGSWEDMHIDIWGPRTGKTTSRAVPAILAAPGGVLVTSNKRDVVDATRDVREKAGPVWVFDPQGIALEEPTWWWNPLSYVTDEVRAAKMAQHFASGSRDTDAKTDSYFDPAGKDLLAGLLLAAALDNRPITDVYTWLTRPADDTAVEILRQHGFPLTADQVAGVIDAPEKQRGGVYGTAQQMASCLTNRQVARWVTPLGGNTADRRPQFSPDAFVRGGGTLYSLSKEGQGTAGPLVTALTVAVVEAAEERAARSAGGRLTTPLLGVLDEAANVCRWRDLPNLYSHYGSRGIVLMTILQSWSQGVEVWGESGMRKLWSASNVKVYGGGVSEAGFLEDLSRVIGDYDRLSSSTSSGRGQRTVSQQLHRERILDVADLAAMPKGRAVVLSSGSRPTLIRTQPWMTGPRAAEVRASIAAHDPQAQRTISEAQHEVAAVEATIGSEARS
ncbi:TraM recognition domain-containing protein [Leifsonia sp. C5G2]|nr:type IV secretory system conjugative DNA transfer family protein [Leifsonia sp. C5G2]NUU08381.1 TraM recognition domain-containing protein [Leifsonia sp. C5G2]